MGAGGAGGVPDPSGKTRLAGPARLGAGGCGWLRARRRPAMGLSPLTARLRCGWRRMSGSRNYRSGPHRSGWSGWRRRWSGWSGGCGWRSTAWSRPFWCRRFSRSWRRCREFDNERMRWMENGLERKFARPEGAALSVTEEGRIEGYASLFDAPDQSGDVVAKGAYAASLKRLTAEGRRVKMLWQHDPAQPIGTWDEVREDARGLYVKGRLLESVGRARGRGADRGGGDRRVEHRLSHAARDQGGQGPEALAGTGALGGVAGDLSDAAQCAGGGQGRAPGGRDFA